MGKKTLPAAILDLCYEVIRWDTHGCQHSESGYHLELSGCFAGSSVVPPCLLGWSGVIETAQTSNTSNVKS